MSNKSAWVKIENIPGHWLRFENDVYSSIADSYFERVQAWTVDTECGRRMAYDMWQFKNSEEVTAFLLRWS